MGEVVAASLRSLPVSTNPGYAVKIALERLHHAVARTEQAISPSFWKKMLGGTSKDHARGVVAVSLEDARSIRGVISDARHSAFAASDRSSKALLGSVDRVLKALDQWRDAALEFEEAIYGSDEILLMRTRKLMVLCSDLKNPASGIA